MVRAAATRDDSAARRTPWFRAAPLAGAAARRAHAHESGRASVGRRVGSKQAGRPGRRWPTCEPPGLAGRHPHPGRTRAARLRHCVRRCGVHVCVRAGWEREGGADKSISLMIRVCGQEARAGGFLRRRGAGLAAGAGRGYHHTKAPQPGARVPMGAGPRRGPESRRSAGSVPGSRLWALVGARRDGRVAAGRMLSRADQLLLVNQCFR